MKKLFYFLIIIFLSVLIIQSSVKIYTSSRKPVAILSMTAGKVFILNKHGKFKKNARRLTRIYPDEIVATGKGSSCVVLFRDRTNVKLEGNSKVLISKVNVQSNRRRGIGVLRGGVLVKVYKSRGRNSFSAFTPNAVAGVRGTTFRVNVASDGSTRCSVQEGNVSFGAPGQERSTTTGQYAEQNIGSGLKKGRTSNNSAEKKRWEKEREAELQRNPERSMRTLDSESQQIVRQNQRVMRQVNELRGNRINRNNAGRVFEVDNAVVSNTARARAIRETANNINRRYGNRRGVRRRYSSIVRHTGVVERQIAKMDRFISDMARQIDKLINQQENSIEDLQRNFLRRGFQRDR